jgi:hypothetical protein
MTGLLMTRSAIHEDLTRPLEAAVLSDRSTGFWLAALFAVVGAGPMIAHRSPKLWALGMAFVMLLLGLAAPRALRPVNWSLTRLGLLIARITNPIVMAVLFYAIFTPIGVVIRLLGKDPLDLRFDPNASGYWKPRIPPGPPATTMTDPF